ncbi:hypothetical protein B0H17DRAFT_502741 [Mycena rosella]|uniref:Uncharacterized protein n=1 Tax=Mycena rosella TaxID=1033263 RepID=A0AAD7C2M2_MYCRO|nr:hypothetical protein B0H17DRAFT_502741 [Mycena rosella]
MAGMEPTVLPAGCGPARCAELEHPRLPHLERPRTTFGCGAVAAGMNSRAGSACSSRSNERLPPRDLTCERRSHDCSGCGPTVVLSALSHVPSVRARALSL